MMSDEYIYEHSNTSHIGRLRDEGESRILVIFHVNPTNGISLAYQGEFEVRFEPPPEDSEKDDPTSDHNILLDADIQISPDWRTITEYRGTGYLDDREPHLLKWSSKRFCLNGAKYQECGAGPAGPPPHPRSYPGPETLRHIP